MPVQPPTRQQLEWIADAYHMPLTEEELETFAAAAGSGARLVLLTETFSTGFLSASEVRVTMIGVMAVATMLPRSQNSGTITAAATADPLAIRSVVIESPPDC